jgi:ABC-type uncharacterized transport system substrate-binding protein
MPPGFIYNDSMCRSYKRKMCRPNLHLRGACTSDDGLTFRDRFSGLTLKKLKVTVLSLFLLLFTDIQVFSHPHTFIDAEVIFHTHNNTITAIEYSWTFDEMISRLIFTDYDINKDLKFCAKEIKRIKANTFDNLRGYNYFTYVNGITFQNVDKFSVKKQLGKIPVDDLLTMFSQVDINKLSKYLNKNCYIDNHDNMLDSYARDRGAIYKWMHTNLGKDAKSIIKYLEFSTGEKMVYSFLLPLAKPIQINGLKIRLFDETNYAAIEIKKVSFDNNANFFHKINGTTIMVGEIK